MCLPRSLRGNGTEGDQHDEHDGLRRGPGSPRTGYRETVLVFVRHTIHKQVLPSDHLFCTAQLLDAAGLWTKAQGLRMQVATRTTAIWVSAKLRDVMVREHFREVLALPFCVIWQPTPLSS